MEEVHNTQNNNSTNNTKINNSNNITPRLRFVGGGWYPVGYLTLMTGDPGVGKSYLSHELAARCSRLDEPVLIISLEDGINDTIVPRMAKMGAAFERVHITNTLIELDRDLHQLEQAIRAKNISLVIIDPISACMGSYKSESNADVRTMLTRLSLLAQACDAAIVCITHLSKRDEWEARQGLRALGAPAFTSTVPVVIAVTEEDDGRRRITMLKNTLRSLLPEETFRITHDRGIVFDPLAAEEDDTWDAPKPLPRMRPVLKLQASQKADAAIALLRHLLRSGPVPTQEIIAMGKSKGLSKNTLIRAKETLMIRSIKRGKRWYWIGSQHEQGRKAPTG